MALFLFVGVFGMAWPAQARAQHVSAANFFDFDYARGLWTGLKTRDEMKKVYDRDCSEGGPGDVWMAEYNRDPQKALEDLRTNPHAEQIKRCHDDKLTYKTWDKMYGTWRAYMQADGSYGWNKDDEFCGIFLTQNIFTGKCHDLPDWRHPDNVKEDVAMMAEANAKRDYRLKREKAAGMTLPAD